MRRQVVWQSAFVLAEYLLRAPPFGQWADVRAVDLGTGTGAAPARGQAASPVAPPKALRTSLALLCVCVRHMLPRDCAARPL